MTTQDLIKLAENKLMTLNQQGLTANINGDTFEIQRIDDEVAETQATLDKLRAL